MFIFLQQNLSNRPGEGVFILEPTAFFKNVITVE
jgi:hypothetical protein